MSFFALAFPLCVLAAWQGQGFLWKLLYLVESAGVVFSLPAAAAGLLDYAGLDLDARAQRKADAHLYVMLAAISLFALDLLQRRTWEVPAGGSILLSLVLTAAGGAAVLAGGWLGGELVWRYGAGSRGRASGEKTDGRSREPVS